MPKYKPNLPPHKSTKFGGIIPAQQKIKLPKDPNAYKNDSFHWEINTKLLCHPSDFCHDICQNKYSHCFSLHNLTKDDLFEIFKKLDEYRSWTWQQIEMSKNNTSCGSMEIKKLEPDISEFVQKYLSEKKFYETDTLYKMEINNRHRVWGIREDTVFYLLWDDNGHYFYKHTNNNHPQKKK